MKTPPRQVRDADLQELEAMVECYSMAAVAFALARIAKSRAASFDKDNDKTNKLNWLAMARTLDDSSYSLWRTQGEVTTSILTGSCTRRSGCLRGSGHEGDCHPDDLLTDYPQAAACEQTGAEEREYVRPGPVDPWAAFCRRTALQVGGRAAQMIAPGIHEISPAVYHADPCYTGDPLSVSLSASGIKTLLSATPAHFAALNPRLTKWPAFQRKKATKAQDRGTVIHSMLLGRGGEWVAKDCQEFSNKDGSPSQTWGGAEAKAWKAQQEMQGIVVISRQEEGDYLDIAEIARQALRQRFPWWDAGKSEQTIVWRRETNHGPIWCRALVDRLDRNLSALLDLKTTAKPIGDDDVARKLALDGADLQAAWYLEGARATMSDVDSRLFHFANVEIDPPYSVRIDTLSDDWLLRAQMRIDRACNLFAECLYAGNWPSWPAREQPLSPPPWLAAQWITDELCEEE